MEAIKGTDSFKNLMYRFATLKDEELSIAKIVYERCNTFHEEQPEEILEEMKAGSVMKWQELNDAVSYTKEWTPCKANSKDVAFIATAEWALSYSTQKTNGLKESDPKMHAVLRLVQIGLGAHRSAEEVARAFVAEEWCQWARPRCGLKLFSGGHDEKRGKEVSVLDASCPTMPK